MEALTVFISIGSNLGQRFAMLQHAIQSVNEHIGTIVAQSSVFETEPWGFQAAHPFLNQVIAVKTSLPAHEVMRLLLTIEAAAGRKRDAQAAGYQSRTLDLDILYFDEQIIHEESLIIPHPRLHMRKFVLLPLCEIAPEFMHPVLKQSNRSLLANLSDETAVVPYPIDLK